MDNRSTLIHVRPHLKIFKGMPSFFPYLSLFFILLLIFVASTTSVNVPGQSVILNDSVRLPSSDVVSSADVNLRYIMTISRKNDGVLQFFFQDQSWEYNSGDPHADETLREKIKNTFSGIADTQKGQHKTIAVRTDKNISVQVLLTLLNAAKEKDLSVVVMTETPVKPAPVGLSDGKNGK